MTKAPIIQTAVTYSSSRKINLGNYEATDIFLSVTYTTVGPDEEEALYWKAVDFVESQLDEKEKEVRSGSVNQQAKKKKVKTDEETRPETKAKADKPVPKEDKEKSEKETKQEADELDEDTELTLETVKKALRDYSAKHSKDKAKKVIESVTGSSKMNSITEDHLADMMIALEQEPS